MSSAACQWTAANFSSFRLVNLHLSQFYAIDLSKYDRCESVQLMNTRLPLANCFDCKRFGIARFILIAVCFFIYLFIFFFVEEKLDGLRFWCEVSIFGSYLYGCCVCGRFLGKKKRTKEIPTDNCPSSSFFFSLFFFVSVNEQGLL